MSGWKASRVVPATERVAHEQSLEHLAEDGFVVTSREVSRDGPWRIEIYGEGERPHVPGDWQWEDLPDTDWVAENQRSFKPFAVGPFWVHPSHDPGKPPANAIPLRIDAGLAFGTGTHATTSGCLELLATIEAKNAVDVGCGSGILAIAMAKLWKRPVIGGDNDGQAVDVAIENADLNGVAPLCRFVEAVGLDHPELQAKQPYDLIVANILAGPLLGLVDIFAAAVLNSGGRVLLSGLLLEQADEIVAAYGRKGFKVERHVDRETGGAIWRTLLMGKK
jgi:ribosomal protein L11 methyltransferase